MADLVAAMGMVTPVGDDAVSTCAALRAGVSGIRQLEALPLVGLDADWDPPDAMRAGVVPVVAHGLSGRARLAALARLALQDLVSSSGVARSELASASWLVGLPAADAAVARWELPARLPDELFRALGPAPAHCELELSGHVAAARLLARARQLLHERRAPRVVVLCVDTYVTADRVALFDRDYRLRSTRAPDGFFAGEGAVALLLCGERDDVLARRSAPPRAALGAIGFGDEPHPFGSELAPTGAGATQALRVAAGGAPVPWLLSDLNGESWRGFELGLLQSRLATELASVRRLEHPAEHVGDLGAAMGALLVGYASRAFDTGTAPGERALVLGTADGSARAAVAVHGV